MTESLRAVVVGAGAWGLPAAAELARRGHATTLVDQVGPAHRLASSHGATRIWRLAHPDRRRVRLARRAVDAWRRLEGSTGAPVLLAPGLLWRDRECEAVAAALAAEGVEHVQVGAADVGRFFRGLRANGVDAVWQPEAGPVLAAEALAAQLGRFRAAGGQQRYGARVAAVEAGGPEGSGGAGPMVVRTSEGALEADVVVVAAGPWSAALLAGLGVRVPLRPVLEQVVYVGGTADEDLPCLIDGPGEDTDEPSCYAMPTPGRGYKMGLEREVRSLDPTRPDLDPDRSPSAQAEAAVAARIRRDLPEVDPTVTGSEVCSWTYGPAGEFVIDTAVAGRVVYACGDSGEGFKFSALMGEVLADLAEGHEPDADVAAFALGRFGGDPPPPPTTASLLHPVRSDP